MIDTKRGIAFLHRHVGHSPLAHDVGNILDLSCQRLKISVFGKILREDQEQSLLLQPLQLCQHHRREMVCIRDHQSVEAFLCDPQLAILNRRLL